MSQTLRAALYIRVSTDGQDTDNQRQRLEGVADLRGWPIAHVYEDSGISGAKARHKRPGFDAMLNDARRRRFDVLMFWSIDRLGRSTATVTAALAELDHAGVALYADKEGMDATTPHGRAMLQMAAVFAELERGMIQERVKAGLARARADRPRHASGRARKHSAGRGSPRRRKPTFGRRLPPAPDPGGRRGRGRKRHRPAGPQGDG